MLNKRGQGISISTIIIAIISLVVLVVLILIFTGYFGGFSMAVGGKTYCNSNSLEYVKLTADEQKSVKVAKDSEVKSEDSCPFTQRRLGSFADIKVGQVCCKVQGASAAPAPASGGNTGGTTGGGTPGLIVGPRFGTTP